MTSVLAVFLEKPDVRLYIGAEIVPEMPTTLETSIEPPASAASSPPWTVIVPV